MVAFKFYVTQALVKRDSRAHYRPADLLGNIAVVALISAAADFRDAAVFQLDSQRTTRLQLINE
jgi:hypothetical protein